MSTHDRSGGVGQGVGVWEHIVKWGTHMFTIFTPLFTLCPVSTTLYSGHTLSHGPISSTNSSTVSLQQLYSQHFQHFQQHFPLQLQFYFLPVVYNLYNTPLESVLVR